MDSDTQNKRAQTRDSWNEGEMEKKYTFIYIHKNIYTRRRSFRYHPIRHTEYTTRIMRVYTVVFEFFGPKGIVLPYCTCHPIVSRLLV